MLKIISLIEWYLPGNKSGGPLRSLANLVEHLYPTATFEIITSNSDLGDTFPYPSISEGWNNVGKAKVKYINKNRLRSFFEIRKIVNTGQYDALYLNSFFSFKFSILIVFLKYIGLLKAKKIILSPKGEFGKAALAKSKIKKAVFIKTAKKLGLYNNVIFHATSDYEVKDTKDVFSNAIVQKANDLPEKIQLNENNSLVKHSGELKIIYFSRIVPIKNIKFVLDVLNEIRDGNIQLDVYGPIEDQKYWYECTQIILKLPSNVVVNYMGPLGHDEKYDTIQKYHLFILPSLTEGYGHAIVEAWLSGRPVIISDNTPWRNISDFGLGWDISLKNKNGFIDKITELIKKDDVEYKEVVKRIPLNTNTILKLDDEIQNNLLLFKS